MVGRCRRAIRQDDGPCVVRETQMDAGGWTVNDVVITSPFEVARRFLGLREAPGVKSHPFILAALQLDAAWPQGDDVPWCSAFPNAINFLLGLPRSHSLAARSWLKVGTAVTIEEARAGFDIVVLERGAGGHVGYYAGHSHSAVMILGGNQGDAVSIAAFDRARILGIRRVLPVAQREEPPAPVVSNPSTT